MTDDKVHGDGNHDDDDDDHHDEDDDDNDDELFKLSLAVPFQ